jgi:hypothetical protein
VEKKRAFQKEVFLGDVFGETLLGNELNEAAVVWFFVGL